MFFSNGVHKEPHSTWSGLIDGIYAIGITLMVLDAPSFWAKTRQLRAQGIIDNWQEYWLTADHMTLLVMSALVCLDLWGLTNIFYRSPGEGSRDTTLLICTSMIIGLGVNVAFQTVFDLRLERIEKGTVAMTTVGAEMMLSLLVGSSYLVVRALLMSAKRRLKASIETESQYIKKLMSACKHCARNAIVIYCGAIVYLKTGASISGGVAIGVALLLGWMGKEVAWLEERVKRMLAK